MRLRQGNLDALCGIYAILNALHHLGIRLDRGERSWLFSFLIDEFAQGKQTTRGYLTDRSPGYLLTEGMETRELSRLIDRCIGDGVVHLKAYAGNCIGERQYELLANVIKSSPAYRTERTKVIETVRCSLKNSNNGALIFGWENFQKEINHWTVAGEITDKRISLIDSDERSYINLRDVRILDSKPSGQPTGDLIQKRSFILLSLRA